MTNTTSSFTDTPSTSPPPDSFGAVPPDNERRKSHFRVGATDFKAGTPRDRNPYKTHHGGFRAAWFRGWDAQKAKDGTARTAN
jgi:hypothetical protein